MEDRRKNSLRRQINDLVKDPNGRISNTKFWAFVACGVATWVVIHMTLRDKMTWEFFVAYLGSVGGFSQISSWLSYKYGGSAVTATTTTTDDAGAQTVVEKKVVDVKPLPASEGEKAVKKDDEGSD